MFRGLLFCRRGSQSTSCFVASATARSWASKLARDSRLTQRSNLASPIAPNGMKKAPYWEPFSYRRRESNPRPVA